MAKCGGLRAGPDVASVGGMWRLAIAVVCVLAGCGADTAPTPTCASLGCPIAASGSPDRGAWEPCDDGVCWCSDLRAVDAPMRECTRIPCATEGALCEVGSHAEYGEYYISAPDVDEPTFGAVCFCSPE